MRIAIVDDIKEERDKLADVLTKQLSRRGIHVNLFEFENGEDFLIAAKERPFTVVFLDIYMSGANGIETARELRTFDSDALLIFTTTSTDHALDGFKVRAMHYLVKPYPENEISDLIDEVPFPDPGFRKIHRYKSKWKQCTGSVSTYYIRRTFFPYDPYSHYRRQRADHPPVLRSLYCIPENGSKILSLQQRRCDQSGACC